MKFSRREMLLAGVGLLTGCAQRATETLVQRPQMAWPHRVNRPSGLGTAVHPPLRSVPAHAPSPATPSAGGPPATLSAIPRTAWARVAGPVSRDIDNMGGISRITVHHEGWTPVWFTDQSTTAQRLEHIRTTHTRDRHWADIGYHYIIDRAGRVWEGRNLHYQGAHVADNNEHNIGVMLLGNFDRQTPSSAQLGTLRNTLQTLVQGYRVPVTRVYTHQELNPTACPGRGLQPRVVSMRTNGYLA